MITDPWSEMIVIQFYASGAAPLFFQGIDAARRGDNETSRRLLAESQRIMDEYAEAENEEN